MQSTEVGGVTENTEYQTPVTRLAGYRRSRSVIKIKIQSAARIDKTNEN